MALLFKNSNKPPALVNEGKVCPLPTINLEPAGKAGKILKNPAFVGSAIIEFTFVATA